jgi:hypothetical protein
MPRRAAARLPLDRQFTRPPHLAAVHAAVGGAFVRSGGEYLRQGDIAREPLAAAVLRPALQEGKNGQIGPFHHHEVRVMVCGYPGSETGEFVERSDLGGKAGHVRAVYPVEEQGHLVRELILAFDSERKADSPR